MRQFKRNITLLALAAAMALSLTACSKEKPAVSAPEESNPSAQTEVSPAAPEKPQAPAEPETAEKPVIPEETAEPDAPERTISYVMQLGGKDTTVYLDVSDTEITLWDSASGGTLLAVARFPQSMPGAAEALRSCDFTDLDEDGNSDLTASFAFPDGSAASLLWFYADGGFLYNEEFSILPGDAPASED